MMRRAALSVREIEHELISSMPKTKLHCQFIGDGSLNIQVHYQHNHLTIVGVKRDDLDNVAAVQELGKVLLAEVKSMQPLHGYPLE
ncbi:hypothetical protein [Pseudomonas sp. Marseille-Q8238]